VNSTTVPRIFLKQLKCYKLYPSCFTSNFSL